MKKVYILLSRTGTWMSNLIYKFTKGDYTHVSFSLEPSTEHFYSFARIRPNNPVVAGMIKENLHTDTFKRFEEYNCQLFELEVSDEVYEKISSEIDKYWAIHKKCKYNFWGTVATTFNINWERKYRYNCAQFSSFLLYRSGAVQLPRKPALMRPMDFLKIPELKSIYKGKLKDCYFKENLNV